MKKFSFVTATYNSAQTLHMYFDSILNQNFNLSTVEVLIVDGGSDDKTIEIAKSYSDKVEIKVLNNSKRLPEYAKAIGINAASGEFCILQDSDEVLVNKNSLKNRLEMFSLEKEVNTLVLTRLVNPSGYSGWGEYYSDIGDPFSAFMFGPTFSYEEKFSKNYPNNRHANYLVCNLNKDSIFPLIDGVQTFRRQKLLYLLDKKELSTHDVSIISKVLIDENRKFAVMLNDDVLHYSSSSFAIIIRKIKSRVIRNVFGASDAGYVERENYLPKLMRIKKILFLPYAFTFVLPMLEGVYYAIRKRNIYFAAHFVIAFITAYFICYYLFLKIVGYKVVNKKFG